jgi:hypothetical protein
MNQARKFQRREPCKVIDFDEAMLDACAPAVRAELLIEADLLARVFAPRRQPEDLEHMAEQLWSGARDAELGRAHARRLAAALKRLAKSD